MSADTTDPVVRPPRRTVGGLDLQSAGALEMVRGAVTSGGVGMLLYQLLTGQIDDIADDVDRLAARVEQVGSDVNELRGDVIRLQAQQPPAHP